MLLIDNLREGVKVDRGLILLFIISSVLLLLPINARANTPGDLKWRYETGVGIGWSSPAIGPDGTIYVGSYDSYLYAIDQYGDLKWRYETDDWIWSSPAIGPDGTIYVGSWDDHLYAINGEAGGLADSFWPAFGQNLRRTSRAEVRKHANVTVLVVDGSGDKLDARVYLDGTYMGSTGWNGEYVIDKLEKGSYEIKANKKGYGENKVSVYLSPSEEERITLTLKEQNDPPKASFDFTPTSPEVDQWIEFTQQATDPDGEVTDYYWTFGDGYSANVKNPTHTYVKPGNYTATLEVTDNDGKTDKITKEITVTKSKDDPSDVYEDDPPQKKIDERYALVVGITNYKHFSLSGLQYPADDARAFKEFLVDSNINKDKIITLLNDEATSDNFDDALRRLVSKSDSDDQVIIYYSGHGASGPDKDGDESNYSEDDTHDEYFATYDTDPQNIYLTAYSDDDFANKISSLEAKDVLIFLDSCYAGGAAKGVKGITKGVSVDNVFTDLGFKGNKVTLFAASTQKQTSYESEQLGHGIFTHFLLEGLKGKADANSDGTITGTELKDYLPAQVSNYVEEHDLPKKYNGTEQQPVVKGDVNKHLIRYPREYEIQIRSILGEKKRAAGGDYVTINLGLEDEIHQGDVFKVYLTEQTDEGPLISKDDSARLIVTSVSGPHVAICKVKGADFYVKEGFVVERES